MILLLFWFTFARIFLWWPLLFSIYLSITVVALPFLVLALLLDHRHDITALRKLGRLWGRGW